MIFGRFYIIKHRVLLYIIKDSIKFTSKYYIYSKTSLFPVLIMLIKETKIIFIAIYLDFLPNQILKKSLVKKINNFLKILEKTSKKNN